MSDVLTDVLRHLSVRGSITGELALGSPWGLQVPAHDGATYHLVVRGSCYVVLDGETLALSTGDMILFADGTAHRLVDEPDGAVLSFEAFMATARCFESGRGCRLYTDDCEGARTHIICGAFNFGHDGEHLRAHLPDRILLRGEDDAVMGRLGQSLRLIVHEARSDEPGAQIALERLVDLLFVQTVRAWLRAQPPETPSWLRALSDSRIARALELLHEEPARAWTVDTLARQVGMSRSGFAARFSKLVGVPPLRYLMGWRMTLAAERLLADVSSSVGEVARSVGYESEAAFTVTFKKRFHAPPATWRRSQLAG